MPSTLEHRRRLLDGADVPEWKRRFFSPASAGLYSALLPRLQHVARGRVLDVGCGAMPFKRRLEKLNGVTAYDTLDVEARVPGVTYIANIAQMTPVPDSSYDTVLCSEVLEHVQDPGSALREIHRVLRAGGYLVLTVPFLARLHEEPQDYFRYTEHGLRSLLHAADFDVEDIELTGSLSGFLGHQISSLLVLGTLGLPVVAQLVFLLNLAFVVVPCLVVDRLLPGRRKFPLGYVVVARRR